jgi:hypothetical protein
MNLPGKADVEGDMNRIRDCWLKKVRIRLDV